MKVFITKVKLRFLPCVELREVMENMVFEFDVTDSTNDSKTESSEEETEDPDDGGSPGTV